jgi:predicted acylesterase/phospholipase RssA/CRP-like cAMP-binding protein
LTEALASLSIFRSVHERDARWLASHVEQVALPVGAVLFSQGDPGDAIYVVESGTLQVALTLPNGGTQFLAVVEAGEVVGEMAVLYERPRAATVSALTEATLVKIRTSVLNQLFATNPSARARFINEMSRRLPSLYLASVPMFAGLGADALRELDLESNWVRLAGGQTLFRQGEPPDYLYVVVRGRLEVLLERDGGRSETVGQLGQGDCVGEVAILTGEPRMATVRAIRDSELVRLSKIDLHRLLERHPRGAVEMVRILASRGRAALSRDSGAQPSTIVILPLDRDSLPNGWVDRLVEALSRVGSESLHVTRRRIDRELGGGLPASLDDGLSRARFGTWLREQEERFQYVVFECDPAPSPWTDLCLRQADLALVVAAAREHPSVGELERALAPREGDTSSTRRELVLLHSRDTVLPSGTARWLKCIPAAGHHHVRIDHGPDHARLARLIAGKAVGLAMSGGGARAYAHVGVIRALKESGIPIDGVAGVSAGSFTAAFCAMEQDSDERAAASLDHIWKNVFRRDPTFPIVAFLSARNYVGALRHVFGEIDIEDLWLPFWCVSTNLSTAKMCVHEQGPLWRAIRASSSLPGGQPPVCIDGELHVDGGVLNNLPADVLRSRGFGRVIASDVSRADDLKADSKELVSLSGWPVFWNLLNPFSKRKPAMPHILEILSRTATVGSTGHGAAIPQISDLYLRPPGQEVSTFGWKAGRRLIERARRYTLEEIEKADVAGWFRS